MKLAVYQGTGDFLDKMANLARMDRLAATAVRQGASLLMLPEIYLSGYNLGDDCARMAEPADGASAREAARIAKHHGIALLYGYAERDGDAIYNSILLVGADGKPLANYRKVHLFGPEEKRLFEPGKDYVMATLNGLTIGLAICYDVEFPEFIRTLALKGADLIAVPTCLTPPYWEIPTSILRARAYENQIFLAYANHSGAERELSYIGMSAIVGPDGKDIQRAGSEGEALLVAEIDPAAYAESRALNTYLADRRPALYGAVAAAGATTTQSPPQKRTAIARRQRRRR
ncbi:carbon-nitrogen hydrolase family protein [Hypericibacter sp.]|uniref:carbon-nitrogen hydrolase family protein n=1 Tax=Hypericibacter sp. TaxID=2705401 RepID=UPI003D6CB021